MLSATEGHQPVGAGTGFNQQAQPADGERRIHGGIAFFVPLRLDRIKHAATQGRGYAQHQLNAVAASQLAPQRRGVWLALHRHSGGQPGLRATVVEKHPLKFMAAVDNSGSKPCRREIGLALIRGGEYEESVFHFQGTANKKPRRKPGFSL